MNIDINDFGDYRLGLTIEEMKKYIKKVTGKKNVERIYKKVLKMLRGSTCAVASDGKTCLIYRWDVERFLNVVLFNKPTYFD